MLIKLNSKGTYLLWLISGAVFISKSEGPLPYLYIY